MCALGKLYVRAVLNLVFGRLSERRYCTHSINQIAPREFYGSVHSLVYAAKCYMFDKRLITVIDDLTEPCSSMALYYR